MALFDRLVGYAPGFADLPVGQNKIGVHTFMAGLAEVGRAQATRAQMISAFTITVAEEPELDFIIGKATPLTAVQRFQFRQTLHDCLLLAEAKVAYTTSATFVTRLNAFAAV
jgi:hypothetical protein